MPSVEPESILSHVVGKVFMWVFKPVVGSQDPSFGIGNESVDPLQIFSDFVFAPQVLIHLTAITFELGTLFNGSLGKGLGGRFSLFTMGIM